MNPRLLLRISILAIICLSTFHASALNVQCLIQPGVSKVALSPDGAYLAMIRKDGENLNALLLIRMADLDSDYLYPRDYRSAKHSVIDFTWATHDTLILTSNTADDARSLHKLQVGSRSIETLESKGYWDIVDGNPHQPTYLAIRRQALWQTSPAELQLRRVDDDSSIEVLYQCETSDFQCITDSDHEPRLIKRNPMEGQPPAWYWNNGESWVKTELSGWTPILACEYGKKTSAFIAGWLGGSVPSISVYDFSTSQVVKKFLEHPDFAIDRCGSAIMNPHPHALLGVRLETAMPKDIWLTKKINALQAKVDETMPGTLNQILSWDQDFKALIIKRTLLDSPAHYVWFHTEDATSKLLVVDGGDIHDLKPGRSSFVQIEAKDGTLLPAILTIPQTDQPQNLPLAIYVGDDTLRDIVRFQWNPVCAYFATQGFATLRMNTRVTPGLLRVKPDALKSIDGVQSMFEDFDKGVQDLVASGLIDPNRVVIAGEGAGAWIASIAPSRCTTRFKAVAALNGVFDLEAYRNGYAKRDPLKDIVPLPFADPDSGLSDRDLKQLSPIEHLEGYPEALFLTIGKWSPGNFKNQISDFRSRAHKNDIKVRFYEDDWWATQMSQGQFLRAWEEATQMLIDYSQS